MVQQVPTPPRLPDFIIHQGPDPINIAIAVVMVVASVGCFGILWVLVRSWIRRWGGGAPADTQAIQELRHTVHQLGAQVTELEERLDFAERVLTARKETDKVERGRA
jgi:flagellar basal body-associated protein FliL